MQLAFWFFFGGLICFWGSCLWIVIAFLFQLPFPAAVLATIPNLVIALVLFLIGIVVDRWEVRKWEQ